MKHIVIYRPHGRLNIETKYYGPFDDFDTAYDYLCSLPALGYQFTQADHDHPGVKFVQGLEEPRETH